MTTQFTHTLGAQPPTPRWQAAPTAGVTGLVNQRICPKAGGHYFTAKFRDIFNTGSYQILRIRNDDVVTLWRRDPIMFWQVQLNFAFWLATAGCGVGPEHMTYGYHHWFVRQIYRFHVYFVTRRILHRLEVRLPDEDNFNPLE